MFKKMLTFFNCFLSFCLGLSASAYAYGVNIDGGKKNSVGVPVFKVSCCCSVQGSTVDIDGAFGSYTIYHQKIGHHVVEKSCLCSSGQVCRIDADSASSYDIKFGGTPYFGRRDLRVERPDGCSNWVITPKGADALCGSAIYINSIPNSYAWEIAKQTVLPSGEVLIQNIAIMDFAPEIYGELIDVVNFVAVIASIS